MSTNTAHRTDHFGRAPFTAIACLLAGVAVLAATLLFPTWTEGMLRSVWVGYAVAAAGGAAASLLAVVLHAAFSSHRLDRILREERERPAGRR